VWVSLCACLILDLDFTANTLINSVYAKALPKFRTALLFALAHQTAGLVIYFPLLFVTSKPTIIILASLGMALDILLRLVKYHLDHVHSMT
jgi:hypothetical protein